MRTQLLLLLTCVSTPVVAAEIVLRDSAAPTGSIVRLSDVAEITGDAADRGRLARMPLMPTPADGEVHHLRAAVVRDLIAAQGERMSDHRLGGATTVEVTAGASTRGYVAEAAPAPARRQTNTLRPSTGFRPAPKTPTRRVIGRQFVTSRDRAAAKLRARAAVDAWLASRRADATPLGLETLAIDDQQVQAIERLGRGELIAAPIDGDARIGDNRVRLTPLGGAASDPVDIEVTLVNLPIVVMATEPIGRGELITASRVALRPLPLDRSGGAAPRRGYREIDSAVGMVAKRVIRAGEALSEDNCQGQVLVHRGEDVEVISGGGGVTVQIQAVARGDGRKGDLVEVEAYDRKDRFAARVVGRRRLAIVSASAGEARLAAAAAGGLR